MKDQIEKAKVLIKLSQYSEAKKELKIVIAADKNDIEAHFLLFVCYEQLKQYTNLALQSDLLVQLAPNWSQAYYLKAQFLSTYYFVPLRGYLVPERLKEAEKNIKQALYLNSEVPEYWCCLGIILLNQSIHYRNYKDSNIDVTIFPSDSTISMINKKEINKYLYLNIIKATERGLLIDPNHGSCINLQAIGLVLLGKIHQAKEIVQKYNLEGIVNDISTHPYTYVMLGKFLTIKGEYNRALEYFKLALRENNNIHWARTSAIETSKLKYPAYRIVSTTTKTGTNIRFIVYIIMLLCFLCNALTLGKITLLSLIIEFSIAYLLMTLILPHLSDMALEFNKSTSQFLSYRHKTKNRFSLIIILLIIVICVIKSLFQIKILEISFFVLLSIVSQILPIFLLLMSRDKGNRQWITKYVWLSIMSGVTSWILLLLSNHFFTAFEIPGIRMILHIVFLLTITISIFLAIGSYKYVAYFQKLD